MEPVLINKTYSNSIVRYSTEKKECQIVHMNVNDRYINLNEEMPVFIGENISIVGKIVSNNIALPPLFYENGGRFYIEITVSETFIFHPVSEIIDAIDKHFGGHYAYDYKCFVRDIRIEFEE